MAVEGECGEGETPSAVIASYGFCHVDHLQMAHEGEARRARRPTSFPQGVLAAHISWPRSKSARYSGGSTARILANTALISVCGRGRSSPS